ncbi:endoplasmic reticulum protein [Ramaria rubella]|nr:endoplasmic reticulum protein [Ramaria rubella]
MPTTTLDYSSIKDNRWKSIAHPPGFTHSHSQSHASRSPKEIAASYASLKQKRAWDLAISPAKSLPMQAFMLYMSGGGVQIFSMGIVFMLLFNPFKALASINASFAPFAAKESSSHDLLTLLPQKLVYLICNALTLALGLWKCKSMGLLPTGSADWLAFETRGESPEIFLY